MTQLTLEGWRLRRPPREPRRRALRVAVVGDAPMAAEVASRLAVLRLARVVLSSATTGQAERAARDLGAGIDHVVNLKDAAPVDALVVCVSPSVPTESAAGRAADAALWAVRTCPDTVVILAASSGLALSRHARRASGLTPHLILSPGAIPVAAAAARRLARDLGVHAGQIDTLAIGGDEPASIRTLDRYGRVGGIPASALGGRPGAATRPGPVEAEACVSAAVELARAVLRDSRKVLCCGGWAEGAYGLAGAYVSAPFRVGARGVEDPLPLTLTLEERSLLQRVAEAS